MNEKNLCVWRAMIEGKKVCAVAYGFCHFGKIQFWN